MAGVAATVEHDLVAFELETFRGQLGEITGAGVDVENAIAGAATEMVMVVFAGQLVAARLARQLDLVQPPLVEQSANVAVDGSDSEPGNAVLGGSKDFIRSDRTIDFGEDFANRGTLTGLALEAGHPLHYNRLAAQAGPGL